MPGDFDAKSVAAQLEQETKIRRKQNYSRGKSRLDPFKDELLSLKKLGISNAKLQRWLRAEKRTVVDLSTVQRWIKKHG